MSYRRGLLGPDEIWLELISAVRYCDSNILDEYSQVDVEQLMLACSRAKFLLSQISFANAKICGWAWTRIRPNRVTRNVRDHVRDLMFGYTEEHLGIVGDRGQIVNLRNKPVHYPMGVAIHNLTKDQAEMLKDHVDCMSLVEDKYENGWGVVVWGRYTKGMR